MYLAEFMNVITIYENEPRPSIDAIGECHYNFHYRDEFIPELGMGTSLPI